MDNYKKIIGINNMDRECERLVYKEINLFQKHSRVNSWRAVRIHNKLRGQYGCLIWPSVQIGKNFYIAHSIGIVIGKTSIIGDDCRIYPGCQLIASSSSPEEKVLKENKKRRHPRIGNNVFLGAGSILIGNITVGDNVVIGAGAIVTKDVPDNVTIVGVNQILEKNKEVLFQ